MIRPAVLVLTLLAGALAPACDPEQPATLAEDGPTAARSVQHGSTTTNLDTPYADPAQPTAITRLAATSANGPTPDRGTLPAPAATSGPDRPTPHPGNTDWVRRRLDAVIGLYDLTAEGAALLRSLDLRQMRGEPGFFGSYGFHGWAGVGEAKPIPVVHELSHSYWGGFPVEGRPDLSWEWPADGGHPPALKQYHADVLLFMSQPPDSFEPLRQRLRNLPGLTADNLEPLLHNLEADMVYNTGGNLSLVPPVLRKYWGRALEDGEFTSWYDAAAWFRSLPPEDRAAAGQYLGFEHLDLRDYRRAASSPLPGLPEGKRDILAGEEKQRLHDLADQFDLLIGDPHRQEDFTFWRSYLRDKVRLHRKHPGYIASLVLPRAGQLADALDIAAALESLPARDRAEALDRHIAASPFLVNLLPAIDDRTLLDLFAGDPDLPEGATLRATASFVERLQRFEGVVSRVLMEGEDSPRQGAIDMSGFLDSIGYGPKEDVRLFLDLMLGSDRETVNLVVMELDKTRFRRLMEVAPAQVRFILRPEQLLAKLDITNGASLETLTEGTVLLLEETSGNFIIDEPFLHAMYAVISARSESSPRDMARLLETPRFSLHGFIRQQPQAAVKILGGDIETALNIIRDGDPVVSSPARNLHQLVHAGPELAATLLTALDQRGEHELVRESLGYIAYDRQRADVASGLGISLENDARFLHWLMNENGDSWLADRLGQAFAYYTSPESSPPAEFTTQFRATLLAAAERLTEELERETLRQIVEQVVR